MANPSKTILLNGELVETRRRTTDLVTTSPSGKRRTISRAQTPVILDLLAEARIHIDWSQAIDGAVAPNLATGETPTRNLVAFPTGLIVNEVPTANVTVTNFYGSIDDPGGTNLATRLVTSGANRSFYIFRPSQLTPALPNGTYGMRFRARSAPGKGDQPLTLLFPGGNVSKTVKELDWENPANEADTTIEHEFTYAGSSDLNIRIVNDASDIIIDRIQVYEGGLSEIPDWDDEVFGGGRKGVAFTDSLSPDANDIPDTTGHTSGLLAIDRAFPQKHTYNGYTVLQCFAANAIPTSTSHVVNQHGSDGGTSTANVLQIDSTSPYQGELASSTSGQSSRAFVGANIAGDGMVIAGYGRSATTHKLFLDSIPVYAVERAFSPQAISRWTIGGFTTSDNADLRGFTCPGKYFYTLVWDRLLTDAEWREAVHYVRGKMNASGATVRAIPDFMVISGDSNGTRANGDWTQLILADGFFGSDPNMLASVTSVGGKGLDDIERDSDSGGVDEFLPDGTITANGRFGTIDKPILVGAAAVSSRRVLYMLPIGTNDWDLIAAYPGTVTEQATAYAERVQATITNFLSQLPETVDIMWHSLKPQTDVSRPNWEAHRLEVNSQMDAWIDTQDRVFLCDTGGSLTLGDRASQIGGGTYYNADEIHFISAGDTEKATNIAKPAVTAWRTAREVV